MALSGTLRWAAAASLLACVAVVQAGEPVDFNRDVRPILSENCFLCHGPDPADRKAGLRVDVRDAVVADRDGTRAIVPGKPHESLLFQRVTASDPADRMPPAESGKQLTEAQIDTLKRWIEQGAPYAEHWAYVKPVAPPLPTVRDEAWVKNEIDRFILARLESEGLQPSPEADRHTLIRRVSLDLTGLPPTPEEVERFVNDKSPTAYEDLVDRLLAKPAYGEHWARMWLDFARYADSAGYADDPLRTIWGYRDYVIRSFNENKPFDVFTIEQIGGDLLPNPTQDQLIATAFHRNTQTNNEGGTSDEEFRTVAVIDRVNTTMAVWMGTTMACAQCHTHKYDPITQEEYFQFYAFFNNTADADRTDEAPTMTFLSEEQRLRNAARREQIAELRKQLAEPDDEVRAALAAWERSFPAEATWHTVTPRSAKAASGTAMRIGADGRIIAANRSDVDTYTLELPLDVKALAAVRIEALPHPAIAADGPGNSGAGNYVITNVQAAFNPPRAIQPAARFIRVELPGNGRFLHLAEVAVFSGGRNVAPQGKASQSSTDFDGLARLAIDGNTTGIFSGRSVSHTAQENDPWWEVDLGAAMPIDRVAVWNRADGLEDRLAGYRVVLLDEHRAPVWESVNAATPKPTTTLEVAGTHIGFAAAVADVTQSNFAASSVLDPAKGRQQGYAPGGDAGTSALMLLTAAPIEVPQGATLTLTIEQASKYPRHTLGSFRVAVTDDARAAHLATAPPNVREALSVPPAQRNAEQRAAVAAYYMTALAPRLHPHISDVQRHIAELEQAIANDKGSTVPIMRELQGDERRTTHIQLRGNFLDLGDQVNEGVPAAFHPLPENAPRNRLTLARWLVSEDNPLTARVTVNHFWDKIFGIGIVATTEDFGSQSELPSHPQLLDYLAVRFMREGWDVKQLLRLMVTSAAYRQSSRITPESFERDPDNRLLARGPRVRLTAEMIRDQALLVSGLLSDKMYGPPVRPFQPDLGLSAAFGGGVDWKTSTGEDRLRRAIYTTWRRSNPYPSMVTFDAPNREVCVLRRTRTNTPLQALVTLNDPVYIEAAQALARRTLREAQGDAAARARYMLRLCLTREPTEAEVSRLVQLHAQAAREFAQAPANARRFATDPIGPAPDGVDMVDLAAWTLAGNVVLNMDEMVMKR